MPAKDRKCLNWNRCKSFIYRDNGTGFCRPCLDRSHAVQPKPTAQTVAGDSAEKKRLIELTTLKTKYGHALKEINTLKEQLGLLNDLKSGIDTFKIVPRRGQGVSEGTVVTDLSDWHVEELVRPSAVNGLNEYTPDIAKARATKLFQGNLRLTRLLQQDIKIDTMVMALLGDFITNHLHEESAENNAMEPTAAIRFAQSLLISGIDFTLNHFKGQLVLPCHSGNHARTTRKIHVASENGHSYEWLMYHALADYYRSEPRVQFIIPDGYHSYLDIYSQTARFHHGHHIKYGGGIGGIFISAYKAIHNWNDGRSADVDFFGHHHHHRDGGVFVSNGSLIGYGPFAVAIKAPYEDPKQTLTLFDKRRGRTTVWPILVK